MRKISKLVDVLKLGGLKEVDCQKYGCWKIAKNAKSHKCKKFESVKCFNLSGFFLYKEMLNGQIKNS